MTKFYDLEIDLSSNDGGLPSTQFKDWMRVRLFGHSVERKLSIPVVSGGSAYFKNDGGEDVTLRRGAAIPIRVGRGACVHVMFDGSPNGMWKVEG